MPGYLRNDVMIMQALMAAQRSAYRMLIALTLLPILGEARPESHIIQTFLARMGMLQSDRVDAGGGVRRE